jgi:NAD+ diphosphatase
MIGFFVELDGDDQVTIQESEIAEARWFSREELSDDLSQISLSYEMIEEFRCNRHL